MEFATHGLMEEQARIWQSFTWQLYPSMTGLLGYLDIISDALKQSIPWNVSAIVSHIHSFIHTGFEKFSPLQRSFQRTRATILSLWPFVSPLNPILYLQPSRQNVTLELRRALLCHPSVLSSLSLSFPQREILNFPPLRSPLRSAAGNHSMEVDYLI